MGGEDGQEVRAGRREYVPEDAVLDRIQRRRRRSAESSAMPPLSVILAVGHAAYVKGEEKAGFKMDSANGVDAGELYPDDVKYTTGPPSTSTSTGSS
ncbi:unnamed protein product, partial [Urochloa humidicola]